MSEENTSEKSEKKEYGKFDRWEIEGAVRTIIEAEQIKLGKQRYKKHDY